MKVVRSIKSIAGLILVAFSLALSGCSKAPSTLTGFTSDTDVVDVSQRIDPEKVLLSFEPFDGIPVNIGDLLTAKLTTFAPSYNVTVVPRIKNNATFRVRGYLVATSDDATTIISYVYDFFDRNDARVHRISGREITGASQGDPWSAVSDGTVNQIAIRSLIDIRNWIYSQT